MRELTFFTTNQTKLAHARYVAEDRNVRIVGFRQRTYHADYIEPRLCSREQLIKASYESALAQLAKAGFSASSHPFILEDTSVRIDALSTIDREIPGVDVKYWMEEQTFASLDSLLRSQGNNRRATVRSDVLLHIPSNLRSTWGTDDEFIMFRGEQCGTVTEREITFSGNLVYPWLDNQSFNKWFIPAGTDKPLGALPIEAADKVDFRRKSLSKLIDFLELRRYLHVPATQLQLKLDRKPNIVLCGYTCSGKTTASQRLALQFGYLHVEASDFMHLAYYHRHGYRGPISIGDFAEDALTQKPTIAVERVTDYILEHFGPPVVVSGFRAPAEIDYIKETLSSYGMVFSLRFIDASEATRFARFQARARPGDNLKLSEFRERDAQQKRMGLDAMRSASETRLLENEGSLNSYLEKVDEFIGESPGKEMNVSSNLKNLSSRTEVGLEDAILISLLGVWKGDETRTFYTTTQISHLISRFFPNIKPKHKDNVSRYFNQDYYAYFDIFGNQGEGARRYRLSNTGYGMAISTLKKILFGLS